MAKPPRLAVRAVVLHENRLLLVNAWKASDRLLCAPGGGVEPHSSLHDNLHREIMEECGLTIAIGPTCLVNEFHDPAHDYHQVDVYFRCTITGGDPYGDWTDPEGIVTTRRWFTRAQMADLTIKPDSLAAVAWGDTDAPDYDPLEPILR
ncbi:NUDIX hydrolase [Yoonia sp. 208BN28-4]|uniref:NUDIX hydrolase n=1 Tax=Yoonia sp. 208BN28-4 TaxID=3126505 RepID=UPI00309D6BBC